MPQKDLSIFSDKNTLAALEMLTADDTEDKQRIANLKQALQSIITSEDLRDPTLRTQVRDFLAVLAEQTRSHGGLAHTYADDRAGLAMFVDLISTVIKSHSVLTSHASAGSERDILIQELSQFCTNIGRPCPIPAATHAAATSSHHLGIGSAAVAEQPTTKCAELRSLIEEGSLVGLFPKDPNTNTKNKQVKFINQLASLLNDSGTVVQGLSAADTAFVSSTAASFKQILGSNLEATLGRAQRAQLYVNVLAGKLNQFKPDAGPAAASR